MGVPPQGGAVRAVHRKFIQRASKHSLRDVEAIQLIREYMRGDKSSCDSYELNLVRGDGSRLNGTDKVHCG